MIHGVLTIVFVLFLLLVGLPVGMVLATKHERRFKELFGSLAFVPACLLCGLVFYGLSRLLSPAFYVFMILPAAALFIWLALVRAGKI